MAITARLTVLPLDPGAVESARTNALSAHAGYDTSRAVLAAVREHARLRPDHIAIRDGSLATTYDELSTSAHALADTLAVAGIRAGSVVAALGERSADTVRIFLALERLGAVYLPVDPQWPAARIEEVLRRAEARCLLDYTEPVGAGAEPRGVQAAQAAAAVDVAVIGLRSLIPSAVAEERGPVDRDPSLEARYVIFTSGTTGRPKGAAVEHRGMVNHLWAKIAELGLGAGDAVAFTAPLVFDISIWQMLAPLLAGGTVVVVRQAELEFPRKLVGCLERNGVTVVELVPTLVSWLVDLADRRAEPILPALRWLISTGEELPVVLAGRALAGLPHARLLNAYGPTECSDDVTHHEVTEADLRDDRLPVGSPVPNAVLYLLARSGTGRWRAAAAGEAGELFVGGLVVGLGYVNDPENNDRAFFVDEFEPDSPTGRLYRTGDAARFDDGVVRYLGRVDRQVKVAGVRMELDEIEAVLCRHPGVDRCAALVRAEANATLTAFYTEREPVDQEELRRSLSATLPEAMIPRRLVVLDAIPLTGNGKTDYRALTELQIG